MCLVLAFWARCTPRAGTNALALDRTSTTAYADPSVEESTAFTEHAFAAVKLQYEARF